MEWIDKISISSCCLKVSGQILRTKFTTESEIDVSTAKFYFLNITSAAEEQC